MFGSTFRVSAAEVNWGMSCASEKQELGSGWLDALKIEDAEQRITLQTR